MNGTVYPLSQILLPVAEILNFLSYVLQHFHYFFQFTVTLFLWRRCKTRGKKKNYGPHIPSTLSCIQKKWQCGVWLFERNPAA